MVNPAGIEPASTASEAVTLSVVLRVHGWGGRTRTCNDGNQNPAAYQLADAPITARIFAVVVGRRTGAFAMPAYLHVGWPRQGRGRVSSRARAGRCSRT